MLAAAIGVGGCSQTPPLSSSSVADGRAVAELERSIAVRAANGLRADRDWVSSVIASPDSLVRWTVRVTPGEALEIDEREIAKAIQFRRSVGMIADPSWVRSLQANPFAQVRIGIPMSAEEAAAFDDRIRTQLDVGPAIQAYGEQHGDEWAGLWIDPVTSGVVARFTGHLEEHRTAILALFAPGVAQVDVREARWSTRQLDAFNAQIWTPANLDWLERLGVKVLGGGSRVIENDVGIQVAVPAPNAKVAAQIIERFDGADWLNVEVSVDPSLTLGFGALTIKVVDSSGRPVVGVVCEVVPDVRGGGGDDTVRDSDDGGTCSWDRIHATGYRVDIWRRFRETLLGSARVTVPDEGTGSATVSVTAP
jgi:hypothetical protein